MPIEQTPLRPIQVDYICDACGQGHYRSTGVSLMSNPPQYPHKCTNCDSTQVFTERFPVLRYAPEGQLIDFSTPTIQ
jgi:DNA-directed RNA polymerase subunit RPC12/RpoP